MAETQEPPNNAEISKKSWPWIIAGMGVIILTLWNRIEEKDKIIQQLNDKAASRSKEEREHDIAIGNAWKELFYYSNKVLYGPDSNRNNHLDIDSPSKTK